MEKHLFDAYSSIISSEAKINIILVLHKKILTPKRISQLTNKRINHISTYLTQLKKNNIVICLNEEMKKGRLYKLTELGNKVEGELRANQYSLNTLK